MDHQLSYSGGPEKWERWRKDKPIRTGYALWFGGEPKDRHVAEQAAVLFAVRGLKNYCDADNNGEMNACKEARIGQKSSPKRLPINAKSKPFKWPFSLLCPCLPLCLKGVKSGMFAKTRKVSPS